MADFAKEDKVRVIKLYGILGHLFGRYHEFVVHSPAEAIGALCNLIDGFEEFLYGAKDRGLTFGVFTGKNNLRADQLKHPCGSDEIRIAPIVIGNKRQGLLQTIIGVVLVVAAVFFPALWPAAITMLAGGVISMLSPQTKGLGTQDAPNNRASYSFNGPVNTSAQGGAIPILYGRMIVGSYVISAGIQAEDQQ
ncbi:tail assembly protein [Pseudomonas phage PMBT14]|uniref:Tail assembly protein n=1 Tax=Pseudomonas phage PMBT14 TaxID=2059855 RepID=A0A2I6PI69_9CAUD|nr:tail protein [Pseudomonas phage PMBT14]AUM59739.1 tail assembly protein [Pseudomonas phage PMBT14]